MPAPEIPAAMIRVEVVYADAHKQIVRDVEVPVGATVEQAIQAFGIRRALPAGRIPAAIGVFGRLVAADATLADGDRVELYRPLEIDPQLARRRRAAGDA